MVIPKNLNFYSILSIQNLQMRPKHYKKGVGVLGMVQIEFLEVKLHNFVKIAHFAHSGRKGLMIFAYLRDLQYRGK